MDLGCEESVIFNTPYYETIKENIENSVTYTILHGGALGGNSNTRYDGLLGNTVLDRFNYAIDYKNNKLYLLQNSNYEKPFQSTLTGFYPMKRGDFATVESIYYQSEAYKKWTSIGRYNY